MKNLKYTALVIIMLLLNVNAFSQKGHGGGHGGGHGYKGFKVNNGGGNNVVIIKKSKFRPNKIVVYHPYWRPKYSYNRRWVYFPKHNFYWDNWRNHYVFYNGTVWLSQPTAPPIIVNVNLEKEKHYELKEIEEDDDDVYKTNENHKSEYKPD